MTRTQSRIKLSLLLGTIIALGVLSLAVNNIPVQALHKEEQKLDKFDNLKEFADAVKKGDANIEKIPLLSMKASNIYDDANKQTQDCINQAAKIGKSLVAKEVVHCVDDVNFYNKQISNSSVPTTTTSAITATSADTGTGGTSTSDTSTPTSDTSTPTSDTSTSSSGNVKENNMINELVKTGKFTEAEAKDFVSKTTQNGADGGSTSDSPKTTNADTSTSDTQASDNTQSSSNQDNNANTQSSSNQDNNTQSSSNQDNNTQSSNANSNKAIDYNDLKDLVHSIKNHVVDSDDITLNAFQDSGAYKGADEATQKCIDLAGKIGNKLGDQEIVHCSEDPNFYQNQISSNNNNANANDNNANNSNSNSNSNSNDNNSGGTGN